MQKIVLKKIFGNKRRKIGEGAFGVAYTVCKAGNCDYVLKSQTDNKDFRIELQALYELQDTKVVPKLHAAWTCKGYGYLVIEKLVECDLTGEDEYIQIKKILDKLYKAGWLHVDTHPGNIMCADKGKKVVIIDFGWAVKRGPKGEDQTYTDHPLRKKGYRGKLTWRNLKIVQNYKL